MKPMTKFLEKHAASIALVVALALLFGAMALYNASGTVDNELEAARLALQADGYTDVQYLDKNLSACGAENRTGYEFDAHKNGVGLRVVACPMPQGYFRLVVKGQ